MTHQMPLLHSGTQRNHKDFSSDVPSNAVLVWHQMQNFLGKLWLWLPKGPRHTKNSTRSEFTICSQFATRSVSLLQM